MARNEAYLARKKAKRDAKQAERREHERRPCPTCGDPCKCVMCGDWCKCDLEKG